MPTPFPGMDPFLERNPLWQQVHTCLIVEMRRFLAPRLRPRFFVAIEQHDYMVKQRYLEIRDVATREVITVIEILSPANKRRGDGRRQYERKRQKVLESQTHLVEIDLLRAGDPMPLALPGAAENGPPAYRIVVSRSPRRPYADVYLFSLRQPIPNVPIPLRPGDEEPLLPLNDLLHAVYDQGAYDLVVDYGRPPQPPLADEDAAWSQTLLAA